MRGATLTTTAVLGAALLWAGSGLEPDEELLLLPTCARLQPDFGTWLVPLHAWVFEPEPGSAWRRTLLHELAAVLGTDATSDPLLRRRAEMFLVDGERRQRVRVEVAGRVVELGPTDQAGHAHGSFELPVSDIDDHRCGEVLPVTAVLPEGDHRRVTGLVQLVGPVGLSVVSDIDDTIKDSRVLDRSELLANTFLRPYRPLAGMAELYRRWASNGASVHYVSASPWQLYPALFDFLDAEGFPSGSVHLRSLRLKGRSALDLLAAPADFKSPVIEGLMRSYPDRRFVLVGDTGEQDPSIYAGLARRFPQQVARILLRQVEGAPPLPTSLTTLPPGRWAVFDDPGQLHELDLGP